jgi:hypothetical protein
MIGRSTVLDPFRQRSPRTEIRPGSFSADGVRGEVLPGPLDGGHVESASAWLDHYWRVSVMPSPVKPEPVSEPVIDAPATLA